MDQSERDRRRIITCLKYLFEGGWTLRDFKNLTAYHEEQYNCILDKNKAKSMRLSPIYNYLEKNYLIEEITEVNDYQIAKVKRKKGAEEWLYPVFLDYRPLNEMAMTFDQAVLICLSSKYTGNSDTATYISRLLNANFHPETIEN